MLTDEEVLAHISPKPGEGQMKWRVCLIIGAAVDLALFLFVFFFSFDTADVFCVTDCRDKKVLSF